MPGSSSNKELVQRIAKLLKQNNELTKKNQVLTENNEELQEVKEKYDQLVHKIAQEGKGLKSAQEQKTKSVKFKIATILYAGIHGSAKITEKYDSSGLMDDLDEVFYKFETILDKYKIIRTKSVGDTFICVGGIIDKNSTNPVDVVLAALEMKQLLSKLTNNAQSMPWDIRFGIHTGTINAIITGKKKNNYDLKSGDTINIASRMEGWSDMGKINISEMTYELIKEFFNCEYYGKMPVRYLGNIQMYNVKGITPELSENGEGIIPNDAFRTKLALVRFSDLQEIMLDRLEKELPDHLYYHNVKHTVDVVTQAELIGWGEGVTDEEILLLKTAALFHDAGHIVSYDEHEHNGTLMVKEYLPKYGYSKSQIEKICEIIMATKLPPNPKNRLEEIICDSDLDYLGRSDMIPVSSNLYKELKKQNKIDNFNDWNKLQIKFLSSHQYFTATARNLREVNKQKQIERIKKLIV